MGAYRVSRSWFCKKGKPFSMLRKVRTKRYLGLSDLGRRRVDIGDSKTDLILPDPMYAGSAYVLAKVVKGLWRRDLESRRRVPTIASWCSPSVHKSVRLEMRRAVGSCQRHGSSRALYARIARGSLSRTFTKLNKSRSLRPWRRPPPQEILSAGRRFEVTP